MGACASQKKEKINPNKYTLLYPPLHVAAKYGHVQVCAKARAGPTAVADPLAGSLNRRGMAANPLGAEQLFAFAFVVSVPTGSVRCPELASVHASEFGCIAHAAWYHTRHGIPYGTVSHAALVADSRPSRAFGVMRVPADSCASSRALPPPAALIAQ